MRAQYTTAHAALEALQLRGHPLVELLVLIERRTH
jgi:hypothetical protein